MASSEQDEILRNMIMTFRVSELQMLLGEPNLWLLCTSWENFHVPGFAGRNKHGKKHELQARTLDLVRIRSAPIQAKIKELYKASQQSQQQQTPGMMNQNHGNPLGYPGQSRIYNGLNLQSINHAFHPWRSPICPQHDVRWWCLWRQPQGSNRSSSSFFASRPKSIHHGQCQWPSTAGESLEARE